MDHRQTSLQFLRATGLIPVKVRPKQKDPFPEWDPKRISSEDHGATLRQLENKPELNIGALFFGKYVDIDCDWDALTLGPAFDLFMPKTPYVWGRASKPRSHRAYVLHEDFDRDVYGPTLRFMKALKIGETSYSLEVRGGRPENGLFTVMPGSYREDMNEFVEWDADVDTSVSAAHIPVWYLLKQLRYAQATALLATYFTEGLRNDMSLAIAGLLFRIRASSLVACGVEHESELDESVFLMSEADCDAIFANLLKIADPNTADRRQRQLNYTNTWNKLANDPAAKVTGGKVLAELIGPDGEKVVRALYRLLSDNEGIEQLEKIAERFVVWSQQGVFMDLERVAIGDDKPWLSKDQANVSLGHIKVLVGGKKIPVVNLLQNSSAIQRIFGLTFDPSTPEMLVSTSMGTKVNQWRGYAVDACPQRVGDDEVREFIDYVTKILACGNDHHADWIFSWCADLFQLPADKPGTALVLVGVQGAGKTFLGEQILGKIIGSQHYVQMNSIESLTNQFNVIADNRIMVQCDEAVHSYQKSIAAKLKSLITDETMTVEPKNINSYKKPNHIHFLFTSNETSNPIFIDPSPHERRFTVMKVSPEKCDDLDYWTHMRAWAKMNLHKILRWLLDYKYKRKFVTRPLITAAKQQIQRLGVDPEVSWILARLSGGFPIDNKSHEHWWHAWNTEAMEDRDKQHDTLRRDVWPNRIYMPALEADFRDFIRQHGRSIYSGSIFSTLRVVFPDNSLEHGPQVSVTHTDPKSGQTVKNRVRMHQFPSKAEIRAWLDARYGNIVDKLIGDSEQDSLDDEIAPEPEHEEF